MFNSTFFSEFLIVLIAATAVAVSFDRLRLPAIMGFLVVGAVLGPGGMGVLSDLESIHNLAELGLIFLMLTIGLEFSFERLRGLGRIAFLGGPAQILLSIFFSVVLARLLGWTFYQGFILGSVIALSSTAMVLKYLIDRGETDSQHGRIAVAILVFQDLAVAPLLILITAFGQTTGPVASALAFSAIKAGVLLAAVIGFARFVLPRFMHWVTLGRSREVFLLAVVILCFGSAWLSSRWGLSPAIGAFFAGLMLANTDYGHQITGEIAPLRHIFVSFFFVSIGLLFDFTFTLTHFPVIAVVTGLVLVLNSVLVTALVMLFGYPPRVALTTGIILSQIGEFSFLLLEASHKTGFLGSFFYQVILSSAVLTIFLTPFLFGLLPPIARICERIPFLGMPPALRKKEAEEVPPLTDHVILCGYGIAGRDVAFAFGEENIPFIVIDMHLNNIRAAREQKVNVLYGDAANEEVLKKAGIGRAKAMITSFGDQTGLSLIIRLAQRLNPDVTLIVRTRFEKDVSLLYELGADIVVMEELEVSIELTRVTLDHFGTDPERKEAHLKKIRARKELLIEQSIFKRALQ